MAGTQRGKRNEEKPNNSRPPWAGIKVWVVMGLHGLASKCGGDVYLMKPVE